MACWQRSGLESRFLRIAGCDVDGFFPAESSATKWFVVGVVEISLEKQRQVISNGCLLKYMCIYSIYYIYICICTVCIMVGSWIVVNSTRSLVLHYGNPYQIRWFASLMMAHDKLDDRLNEFAVCEHFVKVCHFCEQHVSVQDSFHNGLEFTGFAGSSFL